MNKTFKMCGIFLFTVVSLQAVRLVFNLIDFGDNITNWLFSIIFQGLFLGLFPYLLYKRFVSKSNADYRKDLRINAKLPASAYGLAVAIGLLNYVINIGTSSVWYVVMNLFGFTYVSSTGTLYTSPEVLIMEIVTTAIMPAIFEELADRGLLLGALDDIKSDKVKVFIVGVMFGACHQNAPQFGPTLIAGLVMAYMCVKSRSVFPGMIVHFINNFLVVMGEYLSQKGGTAGAVYEAFTGFIYSSWIVVFGTVALAVFLLITSLRRFKAITADSRNRTEPCIEDARTGIDRASEARSIYEIYGYPAGLDARYFNSSSPIEVVAEEPKAKARDHILLVFAFLSAFAVTVMTYIWGVMR